MEELVIWHLTTLANWTSLTSTVAGDGVPATARVARTLTTKKVLLKLTMIKLAKDNDGINDIVLLGSYYYFLVNPYHV